MNYLLKKERNRIQKNTANLNPTLKKKFGGFIKIKWTKM